MHCSLLNTDTCSYHVSNPTPTPPSPTYLATLGAKLRVAAANDALISISWGLPVPHQKRVNVYGKLMDFGCISFFSSRPTVVCVIIMTITINKRGALMLLSKMES